MKHVKKIFAFAVALFMAFAVALPAQAVTEKGSITIDNSAKGETYSVVKLFDVEPSATKENGEYKGVKYTGTIPNSLTTYFETVDGYIQPTNAAKASDDELSNDAKAALKTWADTQTATEANTKLGTGGELVFDNLDLGYYVVKTTQGTNAVSVNTTVPNVSVIDKNVYTPIKDPTKTIDDENVYIGQTVTYTVKFGTANYDGTKKITQYIITDDFAEGKIEDVEVTSIFVDNDGNETTTNDQTQITVQQFDENKEITIPWVNNDKTPLYNNGATLFITYTATVAQEAAIAGSGNTNTVGITYSDDDDETDDPDPIEKTATFKTYAFVLQKTNSDRESLQGATFQLPFYVYETADTTDGAYIYAGEGEGEGKVNTLTTDSNGRFIVKGLQSGTEVELTETAPPAGYNKLDPTVKVTPAEISSTNTTFYYDAQGRLQNTASDTTTTVTIDKIAATPIVVLNQKGTTMPSTGGIGTTIFYVVGGVMVAGAVVFLLTKRRVNAE